MDELSAQPPPKRLRGAQLHLVPRSRLVWNSAQSCCLHLRRLTRASAFALRFRAFSDVQMESMNAPDPVHLPQPPMSELQREWSDLKAWSSQTYPDYHVETRTLFEMSKYISNMNASNYMMSNKQGLMLIMLVDGDLWRAHSKQIFHYRDGAWDMADGLRIEIWNIFLALEGLFLSVADKVEAEALDVSWKWSAIEEHVDILLRDSHVDYLPMLAQKAKDSSDHLRKSTGSKAWQACWVRRVAEMLAQFRVQWDNERVHSLSKLFLMHWDTPLPRSRGVCFADVYLDPDWVVCAKSPTNNCYYSVPYPYHYENMAATENIDIAHYKKQLRLFLESLYYQNEHVFQIKLASMHAAFKKAPTCKMLFEIGKGGDGKGMEAYLQRGLLGEQHSSTLDCGVFLDRQEFRKSGHFAWNKGHLACITKAYLSSLVA